jgi:DNA binding domain, excisionase family
MGRLLTAPEVAEVLGVHVNSVWAAAKLRAISSISVGRSLRFRRQDIERWLEEHSRRAA